MIPYRASLSLFTIHGQHALGDRNPPKILIDAKQLRQNQASVSGLILVRIAQIRPKTHPDRADGKNAPTIMTDEMALVTDIGRMQCRCHRPYDVVADENRQNKNAQQINTFTTIIMLLGGRLRGAGFCCCLGSGLRLVAGFGCFFAAGFFCRWALAGGAKASCTISPPRVRPMPRTISSSQSIANCFLSLSKNASMKFRILRAYNSLALPARRPGTFWCPISATPLCWTILPGLDNLQLPPCSTARSTITDQASCFQPFCV